MRKVDIVVCDPIKINHKISTLNDIGKINHADCITCKAFQLSACS